MVLRLSTAAADKELFADVVYVSPARGGQHVIVALERKQSLVAQTCKDVAEHLLRFDTELHDKLAARNAEELQPENEVARHRLERVYRRRKGNRIPTRQHSFLIGIEFGEIAVHVIVDVRVAAVP